MIFFRLYQHLLPNGRAWRTTSAKRLRSYIQGLAQSATDFRAALDLIFLDLLPGTTRALDEWEALFGLPPTAISTAQRRDRLAARWQALGGQSPDYIQNVLQAAGFDVCAYDWFDDVGALRDPNLLIGTGSDGIIPSADADAAHADRPNAVSGATADYKGRFLVNRPDQTVHPVPADVERHRFIMYIGGPTFGDFASIPAGRKDEFEALCLKICPAHLWIGVLVEFS